jgi:peroxiredoxin
MKLLAAVLLLFAAAEPAGIRAPLTPLGERKLAPAFRLADASVKAVTLSAYRGKIVLLDFWATNCGGCKVEIPWFIEFQKSYRSAGLQAVGMSMDVQYDALKGGAAEGWSHVKPWLKAHPVNYPIVMADDAAMNAYGIKALPATFLIDRQGRVAAEYDGLVDKDDIERNIKALLDER